jgi:hypothetical protein
MGNWMMTELYTRDARRGGQERITPIARGSLACRRGRWPALSRVSSGSIGRCGSRCCEPPLLSLPTHRYPTPFPVPSQAWHH